MDTREVRAAFLDEVRQAVCKDRTKSHGQPEDNFRNIARLWTGWLRGRYRLDVDLDAIMMAQVVLRYFFRAPIFWAEEISVLVGGRLVCSGAPYEVRAHAEVRRAYLGDADA